MLSQAEAEGPCKTSQVVVVAVGWGWAQREVYTETAAGTRPL